MNKEFKEQMQSTDKIDHISTTPHQLRIMHKYNGGFYEYSIDLEGYAEINPILFTKHQREIGLADMIMDLDEINMLDSDRAKIQLLHVLAKTNCGHCNTFINNETFEELRKIVTRYDSDLAEEEASELLMKHWEIIKNEVDDDLSNFDEVVNKIEAEEEKEK